MEKFFIEKIISIKEKLFEYYRKSFDLLSFAKLFLFICHYKNSVLYL